MERHVLFLHDISNVSLENIERISQVIRQSQQVNPVSAATYESKVRGSRATLEPTTGQTRTSSLLCPPNITNSLSTPSKEDEEKSVPS